MHATSPPSIMPGRKPKRKIADSELTPEELARREHQRKQREKALAARASGEDFVSTRKKRKPLERRRFEKRKLERKATNAASRRSAQKEQKRERSGAPDVVIIPIFWKGEAKQMGRVLGACADVEKALSGGSEGRKVLLDGGHKYTPGQKFAHWEHKGVLLRVEVGPREAERGHCTLARTFTPGEPAHRVQRVAIGATTLWQELEKLNAMTQAPGWIEGEDGGAADGLGESARRPVDGAPQSAAAARGGDDLEENFESWGDAGGGEAEEEGERVKKKKKKSKKEDAGGEDASSAKPAKKQKTTKTVEF